MLLSYFRKGLASEGGQTFSYLRPRQRDPAAAAGRAVPEAGTDGATLSARRRSVCTESLMSDL